MVKGWVNLINDFKLTLKKYDNKEYLFLGDYLTVVVCPLNHLFDGVFLLILVVVDSLVLLHWSYFDSILKQSRRIVAVTRIIFFINIHTFSVAI
jgi:hypothetical protein